MNILKHKLTKVIFTAGALLAVAAMQSGAQSGGASPDRLQAMAEVMRLQDQGQLARAYELLLSVERDAPGDRTVATLKGRLQSAMQVEGINYELISTTVAETQAPTAPEASAAAPVGSISEARRLANRDRFDEALDMLEGLRETADADAVDALVSDILLRQERAAQGATLANARDELRQARRLASADRYDEALALLTAITDRLPATTANKSLLSDVADARRHILLDQATYQLEMGQSNRAAATFALFEADPGDTPALQKKAGSVSRELRNPYAQNIRQISPEFVARTAEVRDLLVRGRAQFVNGDFDGARTTFAQVETIDPNNVEAKAFLSEIAQRSTRRGYLDRQKTRAEMLDQVSRSWQQPRVFQEDVSDALAPPERDEILGKLEAIIIPRVTFQGTTLPRAVQSLSEFSEEFDRTTDGQRGVNMVVTDGGQDRQLNFSVRNLSLLRILDIVAQQSGFQWDVVDNVVEFTPADAARGRGARLQRAIIPISKGTLDLILDLQTTGGGGGGSADPFAAPTGPSGPGTGERQDALTSFFESSGISFPEGASIVSRGSRLLVNQTARNIEEIRRTLRELDITDQVEIEAKFMEVAQNDLEELGFNWQANARQLPLVGVTQSNTITETSGFDRTSNSTSNQSFTSNTVGGVTTITETAGSSSGGTFDQNFGGSNTMNRTVTPQFDQFGQPLREPRTQSNVQPSGLRQVFGGTIATQTGFIGNVPFSVAPGEPANTLDLGLSAGSPALFATTGVLGPLDLTFVINALQRQSSTDLLSSPRVTVMSGKQAQITVAQEFRYPERYGEPQVQASAGSQGGGAATSVASGVPEDFTMRNLGVELSVTPTVEPNDKINLSLSPQVTEFEGFVAYGGPNIAIAQGSDPVQAPSGYFQPIFSVRSVETEVTVFDGATVVLGGLTREEVKAFKEKVPLLGDLPLVGRLFRSEGETAQKRNLIIFVTANLISPGGSHARQDFRGTPANSLFQNPSVISPGGTVSRDRVRATVE